MNAERGDSVGISGKVVCCIYRDGELLRRAEVSNLVTTAGANYFAQRAAGVAVPDNFTDADGVFDAIGELYQNDGTTPAAGHNRSDAGTAIATSQKAPDSGYPKLNDTDTANTGKGTNVLTVKWTYGTSEGNGAVDAIILTNPSPGASEPILAYAQGLAALLGASKTGSDIAVIYWNFTFAGT